MSHRSPEHRMDNTNATPCAREQYILPWALIAVGVFARTWHLGSWPALHGDEAAFGVMAMHAAAGDYANVFAIRPYQTPLYACTLAPFVHLLGNTILAIRILPWITGMCGIWSMYAAGQRMFGRLPGLYAAGTFAIMPMVVVTMARIGWDAAVVPGMLAFATWMFIVAWQDRSLPAAFVAGLTLAGASWFSIAAMLSIPALVAPLS